MLTRTLIIASAIAASACATVATVDPIVDPIDFEQLGFPDPLLYRGGELTVTVRLLNGDDHYVQVTHVRAEDGAGQATISRATPTDPIATRACVDPSVSRHVSTLERLRVSPAPESLIVIHGNLYELWVASGSALNHFSFAGVPGDPSGDNPLQTWADEFIRIVDASCAGDGP